MIGRFSARLCFMARAGSVAGALFAAMFENLSYKYGPFLLNDTLLATGVFAFFVWLFILLLFGVWLRYTIKQIFIQSLIVTFLTAAVIAWVYQSWAPPFIALLGFFIGALIGSLLCLLCSLIFRSPRLKRG